MTIFPSDTNVVPINEQADKGHGSEQSDTMRNFIVKAEVKRFVKDMDHQMSNDFLDTLNRRVSQMLSEASVRAQKNGRKQIRSHDL